MTLDKLAEMMTERFDGVGQEFVSIRGDLISLKKEVGERFDKVEAAMNHRFDEVGSRLTSVESRTRILEAR